jgi:quercetin dioxygenase-like cupin family protein/DNA-binding XRE family transcriptional regulator
VSAKIFKKYERKKLTLEGLSNLSKVSKAMLSQIESEKVNATIATVWKISQGLDVEFYALIRGESDSLRKFFVTRKENAQQLELAAKGVKINVISPLNLAEDLEFYDVEIKPGAELRSEPHPPKTEEYLKIIAGQVKVEAGKRTTTLNKGDFIIYDGDVKHAISNEGKTTAKLLLTFRFKKES